MCFLLTLSFTVFSQDKSADQNDAKQLREIYQEFDRAGKILDLTVIEKYLDENYELEDGNTKLNRTQTIEQVKQFSSMVEKIEVLSSKIEKISVSDGRYSLEISSVMKGTLKAPDGATVPFESYTKSTDIWIKTENGWREISQIGREKKFSINGREITK